MFGADVSCRSYARKQESEQAIEEVRQKWIGGLQLRIADLWKCEVEFTLHNCLVFHFLGRERQFAIC